jgi:hypothetical protein
VREACQHAAEFPDWRSRCAHNVNGGWHSCSMVAQLFIPLELRLSEDP